MAARHLLWVAALLAAPSLSFASDHTVPGMHATIQEAVDMAADGDRILLSPGVYSGAGNFNISISGKSLSFESATGNRDAIIDCQNAGSAFLPNYAGISLRGLVVKHANIIFDGYTSISVNNCELDGQLAQDTYYEAVGGVDIASSTIQGGGSVATSYGGSVTDSTIAGTWFSTDWSSSYGDFTATNCTFDGSGFDGAFATATNCRFNDGGLTSDWIGYDVSGCTFTGGGINGRGWYFSISDCTFDHSGVECEYCESYYADLDVSGSVFRSTDVWTYIVGTAMSGCTFEDSSFHASDWSYDSRNFGLGVSGCTFLRGGIDAGDIPVSVNGCEFLGSSTGISAIYNEYYNANDIGTELSVTYCAFSGGGTAIVTNGAGGYDWYNEVNYPGGLVGNCTIVSNQIAGIVGRESATLGVYSCILWKNGADLVNCTANNSDVSNGPRQLGNIRMNPLFVRDPSPGHDRVWGTPDDDYGDLHLRSTSPCLVRGMGAYGPPPSPLSLSIAEPSSCMAGETPYVDLWGSGFQGAQVVFNGLQRYPIYGANEYVYFRLKAADTAVGGVFPIQVLNGDGTLSNTITFTVNNPKPVLTSINPTTAKHGTAGLTLVVNGKRFVPSSMVTWNGAPRPTHFNSSGQITAEISAADLAVAGTAAVTVVNPAPGGGSARANFRIR